MQSNVALRVRPSEGRGDEFVVMLPDVASEHSVAAVAGKLRRRLAAPYALAEHGITVTASIGVALYCADGRPASDLIKQADFAMSRAKTRARPPARRKRAGR